MQRKFYFRVGSEIMCLVICEPIDITSGGSGEVSIEKSHPIISEIYSNLHHHFHF
jgi:hypothetical protein